MSESAWDEAVRRQLAGLERLVLAGTASEGEEMEYVLLAAVCSASLGIEQPDFLLVSDIADHFTKRLKKRLKKEIGGDAVLSWLNRNSPDRSPEEIAKAPSCPQPAFSVGVRRPINVWLSSQLKQWDDWYDSRPGQGKGGGRPPKVTS